MSLHARELVKLPHASGVLRSRHQAKKLVWARTPLASLPRRRHVSQKQRAHTDIRSHWHTEHSSTIHSRGRTMQKCRRLPPRCSTCSAMSSALVSVSQHVGKSQPSQGSAQIAVLMTRTRRWYIERLEAATKRAG
eukprot:SAG31_NODE_1431_length_8376_cov_2.033829_8_plen_135_part_00